MPGPAGRARGSSRVMPLRPARRSRRGGGCARGLRSWAVTVRIQVHGPDTGGDRARHVVAQAVTHVHDRTALRVRDAQRRQGHGENGRVGLGHADHGRIDDDADFGTKAARGHTVADGRAVAGVTDASPAQGLLHLTGGVGDDAERQPEGGDPAQRLGHPRPHVGPGKSLRQAHDVGRHGVHLGRGDAARCDKVPQVLQPPLAVRRLPVRLVTVSHRTVVCPLQIGDGGLHAGGPQWRQQEIRRREDHDAASVEQDRVHGRRGTFGRHGKTLFPWANPPADQQSCG